MPKPGEGPTERNVKKASTTLFIAEYPDGSHLPRKLQGRHGPGLRLHVKDACRSRARLVQYVPRTQTAGAAGRLRRHGDALIARLPKMAG